MAGKFNLNGGEFDFVSAGELTLGEARTVCKLTGSGLNDLDDRLTQLDPSAWVGLLLVSMRRSRPSTKESELTTLNVAVLGDVISELASAMETEEEPAEEADPPAEAPARPSGRKRAGAAASAA